MHTFPVAKALIINEKGELLVLRRSKTDSRRPGQWDMPGGRVDPGEDVMQALVREIKEETGVDISLPQLRLVYATSGIRKFGAVTWMFFAVNLSYTPNIVTSYEHDAFVWMRPSKALEDFEYELHKEVLTFVTANNLLEVPYGANC